MTGPKEEKWAPIAVQGLIFGTVLLLFVSVLPYMIFDI